MTATQIETHTDGAVSCGTRLWRFRGRLQLTVVVKAVFAIVPDAFATPTGPGEIVPEDRHRDASPMRSVEAASDLAPYLPRCDVVFVGHAHAPAGPAAASAVRLGLSRDGQRLLDKTIHVYGNRDPAGAPEPFTRMPIVYERAVGSMSAPNNPIGTEKPNLADPTNAQKPAGFGPISRLWPVRRLLVSQIERDALARPIAEIPEAIAWAYFQAAPPDQQLDPLRGGEWLVLDGLHPTLPRVQTRLPTARGAARVTVRGPGAGTTEAAIELVCDTLAIDGDRQTLSLSWRGRYELPDGEASLPSLSVLAALEAPGVPVDWARIRAAALEPAAASSQEASLATTTMLAATQIGAVATSSALPFEPSGAPARPPSVDATPWGAAPMVAAPVIAIGAETALPQPSPLRPDKRTMALPAAQQAILASLPAVPFAMPPRALTPAPFAAVPGAPWDRAPATPAPFKVAPAPKALSTVELPVYDAPPAMSAPLPIAAAGTPLSGPAEEIVGAPLVPRPDPNPSSTADTSTPAHLAPQAPPPVVPSPAATPAASPWRQADPAPAAPPTAPAPPSTPPPPPPVGPPPVGAQVKKGVYGRFGR